MLITKCSWQVQLIQLRPSIRQTILFAIFCSALVFRLIALRNYIGLLGKEIENRRYWPYLHVSECVLPWGWT